MMIGKSKTLAGWGRYPVVECQLFQPRTLAELQELVDRYDGIVARGNGRSYGDNAMSAKATIDMRRMSRFLRFERKTGELVVEAGILLSEIVERCLPEGWFLPVTPGTKYVTVGGAIANNVHGKNHHKDGAFSECLNWIEILTPNGSIVRSSPTVGSDLFWWTVGGLGLTGVIIRASIWLMPVQTGWICQRTRVTHSITDTIGLFEDHLDATYSVAWLDLLNVRGGEPRAILTFGEHASIDQIQQSRKARLNPWARRSSSAPSVPFSAPKYLLNRLSMKGFNSVYFNRNASDGKEHLVSYEKFFYPLDGLRNWNRLYGPDGFAQFQCVFPLTSSSRGLRRVLNAIRDSNPHPLLAVMKRLGKQQGNFSFPMEGYTLALDFAISPQLPRLLEELTNIAIEFGGRIYLAKDSHLTAQQMSQLDPRAAHLAAMRYETGADIKFESIQSERLGL